MLTVSFGRFLSCRCYKPGKQGDNNNMKTILACAAISAALVCSAVAEGRYDRKLEAAVKAKVAEKIGDIRIGFDLRQRVEFIRLPDPITTGSVKPGYKAADRVSASRATQPKLSLAVGRKATRRVF